MVQFTRSETLPEVVIIDPDVHKDGRGYFVEIHRDDRYRSELGVSFVQDNVSRSTRGVLRGMHYQLGQPQGKLLSVLEGEIFDVAVDVRRASPTFGQWEGVVLSSANHRQLYIPEGFAHGFCVLSDMATVFYKCTQGYAPEEERGMIWNDPKVFIDWPLENPVVSPRDEKLPLLGNMPVEDLPPYTA